MKGAPSNELASAGAARGYISQALQARVGVIIGWHRAPIDRPAISQPASQGAGKVPVSDGLITISSSQFVRNRSSGGGDGHVHTRRPAGQPGRAVDKES